MKFHEWAGAFLVGISAAIIVFGGLVVRLTHIDMTQTRLLVEFWWLWSLGIFFAVSGLVLLKERK
jgi:hypothetical protein